jgi:hypothetical protein
LQLRLAPSICPVVWKKVMERRGSKETEHTVVPNVAIWNAGFSESELSVKSIDMQKVNYESTETTIIIFLDVIHCPVF